MKKDSFNPKKSFIFAKQIAIKLKEKNYFLKEFYVIH